MGKWIKGFKGYTHKTMESIMKKLKSDCYVPVIYFQQGQTLKAEYATCETENHHDRSLLCYFANAYKASLF